jgi:hypothetical protein
MSEPHDESTSGPGPAFQPPVYGNGIQPPVYGNQPANPGYEPPAYGSWPPPTAPSAWGDGGVGSPYGTGYTFTTTAPPPPPRKKKRRAGVFVALGLIAAFAVGVAGAEVGRYVTSGASVPTVQATSQPSSTATTEPSAVPSAGSTSPGTSSGSATDTSSIAAIIDPALVDIVSTFSYQKAEGAGTGIVLTATGEILTNNHVIAGATSISVTDVGNGQTYTASVVGYDAAHDVAVLQLQGVSGLQTASVSSATATVGEAVVAAGNAGGTGGTPTAAAGSVTAVNQSISASNELTGTSEQLSDLIQVNANIQAGDSGGALVDSTGAVIGINTAGSSNYSLSSRDGQRVRHPDRRRHDDRHGRRGAARLGDHARG